MRGGPGLGNIAPSQGDYNQIVHGGGHGDYHPIVLAPASVQEAIDLTVLSFDLAEKYRVITIVLADGSVGQMMEPAELPEMRPVNKIRPDWAITGAEGREPQFLTSIYIDPANEEVVNHRIIDRWYEIQGNEVRFREYYLDDAEFVVVGFGTAGRIALSAVRTARAEGIKVGLFRPITLSPYPFMEIEKLSKQIQGMLVVEMNTGQMLEDVRLATQGRVPIEFYGRLGGIVPFPDEILTEIHRMVNEPPNIGGDPRARWLKRLKDGVITLAQ
jgi:2-oxoglutarate ferredoxin oxidoreductase subunit alpha